NYFWPMMFSLLEEPETDDFEAKKAMLLRHRIALWDVLASCEREGSLDSHIIDETPNDIRALLARYPSIQYILFNGGKAHQSFQKHFPDILETYSWKKLPSTSPAYTMKREIKRKNWHEALQAAGIL
ncbi:MAG: DNA-deoxyinosine glycosylase, partial [Peptococcaceae bacterium]|nr:DNA-deoxyinosine glycosylase [Peptococcaceae bacterium]